jgi:sugar lactone lactonase YvrE
MGQWSKRAATGTAVLALVLLGTNAQMVAAFGQGLLGSTAQSITTIAGNGMPGSSGNGGPAVSAQLNRPNGVAIDLTGALYISDGANNTVRKVVNPTSLNTDIITAFAGTGERGFLGDNGPATSAELNRPAGVAVDHAGDVFTADSGNNRVREVLPSGTIKTFAGNGLCGRRVPIGNGLQATRASLCAPTGVAVDGDKVYISDTGHAQVRVVGAAGIIQAFTGRVPGNQKSATDPPKATKTKLGMPTGLAVDSAHDVIIADTSDCVIREVQPDGKIRTVAGTGKCGNGGKGNGKSGESLTAASDRATAPSSGAQATKTELNRPTGVGVDAMGDIYIADTLNNLVREVKPSGVISTVAGTGSFGFSGDGGLATKAELASPTGSLAISGSAIYFSDTANARVRGVFTGPPPVLPETQWAIALPLAALILVAGAVLLRHRRRTRSAAR